MNYNPMDLIHVKEFLLEEGKISEDAFNAITDFIEVLINFEKGSLPEILLNRFGYDFMNKQNIIELAYRIQNKTKPNK